MAKQPSPEQDSVVIGTENPVVEQEQPKEVVKNFTIEEYLDLSTQIQR